ncbi:peptidase inhibitor family I36 protein [Nocardiopsis baichengensis]|uniref:peptidase inhibitor family I36 protein n=1 Tax=Nocardiopsis baichengensis TaxID=280240 RepID=UPI0003463157|nr:peptidase inhibitor family I36 protein [Nocardiopsis baichengensis]
MKTVARKARAAVAALAMAAGALALTAAPAQADYSDCPWGKVCVFSGWHGGGERWDVPSCGHHPVPDFMTLKASSVKTHGNDVGLIFLSPTPRGHVPRWTETNLSPEENNRLVGVVVYCGP